MGGYLIYHPKRSVSIFGDLKVYYDSPRGNQDPYIWNKQFLHSYCHISQIRPALNDINFWVSGDTFPNFSHLYCDLVFVIRDMCRWEERNRIDQKHQIIDSAEAFIDHYQWAERGEHLYKRRHRFTLKADADRSFQPQDANKELIDIVPFLIASGLSLERLRRELRANPNINRGSKPFYLGSIASELYEWLDWQAAIKLKGEVLQKIRLLNPEELSSGRPRKQ